MLRVGRCVAVLTPWFVACALRAHPGAHASLVVLDQLIATNPASQELRIRRLIVPKVAPTYCAYGMMFSDLKHDYQRTYHAETDKVDLARVNALYAEMEAMARDTLRREGIADADMLVTRSLDMQYYGQFRDRNAPVAGGTVTNATLAETMAAFHRIHRQSLGYSDTAYPTEIVRLHLSGSARLRQPRLNAIAGNADANVARKGTRSAYFAGHGLVDTPVYDGNRLLAGASIRGPAIVEETFTTFVLPQGATTTVDTSGNYITTLAGE